ncbi:hypothetical protein ACOI1C_11090 [Bacillus sp. DJP31]|uniref:hypothetical protein n=1 Tax=Bacillus sp. DJP31 TaxID=3409789 RepID=UPI003BB5D8B4
MLRENKPIHLSPYDHPDIYPGPRPCSSFIFYKGVAHRIEEEHRSFEESIVHVSKSDHLNGSFLTSTSEQMTVGEFLSSNNEVSIHDRIPVLAYGSNVCLAQLLYKSSLNSAVSDLYLCFRATLKDTDVIYGSFLAPYGALPAILAPIDGAETEVWVTLLDPKQLEHMTTTEGGYKLKYYEGNKLQMYLQEQVQRVYAYHYPKALIIDDSFYRFTDIPGTSPIPSSWQADMLNRLHDISPFEGTREEFIHLIRSNYSFRHQIELLLANYEVNIEHPDWNLATSFQTLQEIRERK